MMDTRVRSAEGIHKTTQYRTRVVLELVDSTADTVKMWTARRVVHVLKGIPSFGSGQQLMLIVGQGGR